jgi:hypothetical protein
MSVVAQCLPFAVERLDDRATRKVQLVVGVDIEARVHGSGLDLVKGPEERAQGLDRDWQRGRVVALVDVTIHELSMPALPSVVGGT